MLIFGIQIDTTNFITCRVLCPGSRFGISRLRSPDLRAVPSSDWFDGSEWTRSHVYIYYTTGRIYFGLMSPAILMAHEPHLIKGPNNLT